MALASDEEAKYVEIVEQLRRSAVSELTTSAQRIYQRMFEVEKRIVVDAVLHAAAYGDDTGADADLDAELLTVRAAFTALHNTGLIAESQADMEARMEAALGGIMPPM